jgi:cation diffusion facilitator CzcD-associated flavoprotein CzcO
MTRLSSGVSQPPSDQVLELDVAVIGAGFTGLYALHKMRELGLTVRVFEQAGAVGGTWHWNRYPGARCDIESVEYSYSFSPEVEQEWNWSETLAAQPEIEAYLNFVADRLGLRPDIELNTKVVDLTYEAADGHWRLTTEHGQRVRAQFVIAATGILSEPLDPAIPGKDSFAGISLYTNRFPSDGFDFSGKRVGLIGTGSTGVQATPVIAESAAHLHVFQRSAAYTLPSTNRAFEPGELDDIKASYPEIRQAQTTAHVGAARLNAFSVLTAVFARPPIKTASEEERLKAVEERGVAGALYWSDVFTDYDASLMASDLYAIAVARLVKDPTTAAALVPHYPFGCKRPIIDNGYYETFNQDNVSLVDLRATPLDAVTEAGIRTSAAAYDLDVIVYATGFDAVTGALSRIDVRGNDGALLRDVWARDGAVGYLGLQVAGFPNLFMVQGPGSPSAAANFVYAMELHVDWIADAITYLSASGHRSMEVLQETQDDWIRVVNSLVEGTLLLHPTCDSWWNNANVPGKKRVYTSYVGGMPTFRRLCDEVALSGYQGFKVI